MQTLCELAFIIGTPITRVVHSRLDQKFGFANFHKL